MREGLPEGETVCTGHQLALLTGPLYFIYKIASTIALSKKLVSEGVYPKVTPVFWLASEDHDFAEIRDVNIHGKRIRWESKSHKGAVGRLPMDGIQEVGEELAGLLGSSQESTHFLDMMKDAYHTSQTWSEATARLVRMLFKDYPLHILEPDNADFKRKMVPYFKRDIFENVFYHRVNETTKELLEKGEKTPIEGREINVFYLQGYDYRVRIVNARGGDFSTVDGKYNWSKSSMEDELDAQPENFSPNVVLRPLYQEVLLNNIAYIGGPSEVAYWKQLTGVFEEAKVQMPQVLRRDSALLLTTKQRRVVDSLKLDPSKLMEPLDACLASIRGDLSKLMPLGQSFQDVKVALSKLKSEASSLPSPLASRLVTSINSHLAGIRRDLALSSKGWDDAQGAPMEKLRLLWQALHPQGELQERYDNFIAYYLENPHGFIGGLVELFDPRKEDNLHILEIGKAIGVRPIV